MLSILAFYLIFLGQIGLISIYYPRKFTQRIQYVTSNFPPDEYPKLYPEPLKKINSNKKIYLYLNYIIAMIGLFLLATSIPLNAIDQVDYQRIDSMPLVFGMVQFIPVILLEIVSFKQFKLMREANLNSNKTADLTPRTLFAYVSPALVAFTVFMAVGCVCFELYINEFKFTDDLISKTVSIILCNGLFVFLTYKSLHGKKIDPYQTSHDRSKQIKVSIHSMIFVSLLVSVFFVATGAINTFGLTELEFIANSLYFQLISIFGFGNMLRSLPVEDVNFDVYKESALAGK